jgi:hypothetical protein
VQTRHWSLDYFLGSCWRIFVILYSPHKSSSRRCGSTLATMLCHLGHAQRHGDT